jgi:hypothetical protein
MCPFFCCKFTVSMLRREVQMKSPQSGKDHFIVNVLFFPFSEATPKPPRRKRRGI